MIRNLLKADITNNSLINLKSYLAKPFVANLLIFLALVLLTIAFLYPVATNLDKLNWGDGRLIAWAHEWNYQYFDSLFTHQNLSYFDANIFYPNKQTLLYSDNFLTTSIISYPLFKLTNNIALVINLLTLVSFFLMSLAGFLIGKHFTKSNLAGLVSAIVIGFCPYRLTNVSHFQIISTFWIPFMFWYYLKYSDSPKKIYLVLIGLCLTLQGLSSWYHLIFIYGFLALLVLIDIFRKKISKRKFILICLTVVLSILPIIPIAIQYLQFSKQTGVTYSIDDVITYSADIEGYIQPYQQSHLGKFEMSLYHGSYTRLGDNINSIGFGVILISAIGIFLIQKSKKGKIKIQINPEILPYLYISIIFFTLSLGPKLYLHELPTNITLPYKFVFEFIPQMRFIRNADRYSSIVWVCIGVFVAVGVKNLLLFKNKLSKIILILLIILIFFEYFPSLLTADSFGFRKQIDRPLFHQIETMDDVKAIAILPLPEHPANNTEFMLDSMVYKKPIFNGYSGYEPPSYSLSKDKLKTLDDTAIMYLQNLGITHLLVYPGIEIKTQKILEIKSEDNIRFYKIIN